MDDTAHRQDTVGGLYDFPLREYSTQGRWASPDPAGRSATCPKDPQTQNRYAYVRNNPITFVDPIGAFGTPPCSEYDPLCQMCAANPDAPMCQNSCDPLEPFCGDPAFGGGGFLPAGSNNPEKPPQFPWLLLPIGFFQGQDTGTQTLSLVRARCDENPKERNGPEYNLGCLWKGATRVSDSPCVLPISQSGPGGCIDRETARVNLRDGSYTTLVCAQKITIDMNCDPETARKPWFIEGTVKIK
jgi:RHS repeat-associated protein